MNNFLLNAMLANSLVIFDEEGHVPTAALLWREKAASREVFEVHE